MYQELRSEDINRIRSFTTTLERTNSWEELIENSLLHLGRIVSNDCLCRNEWSEGFGNPLRVQTFDEYEDELLRLMPALEANIGSHPILSRVGWEPLREAPLKISEFESDRDFFQNPIFRDFYRHVDSHFQMAYVYGKGSGRELLITMNRRLSDFTAREIQSLKLSSDLMAPVANLIRKKESHEKWFATICRNAFMPAGLSPLEKLSTREIHLLKSIVDCESSNTRVREDTNRKVLQSIREKLDVESTRELISVLVDLVQKPKKTI